MKNNTGKKSRDTLPLNETLPPPTRISMNSMQGTRRLIDIHYTVIYHVWYIVNAVYIMFGT